MRITDIVLLCGLPKVQVVWQFGALGAGRCAATVLRAPRPRSRETIKICPTVCIEGGNGGNCAAIIQVQRRSESWQSDLDLS